MINAIDFGSVRYVYNPPRPRGSLFRVLGDVESPLWGKTVRAAAPAPAVNRTGSFENNFNMLRSKFTAPWQWFGVDLLALAKYGKTYRELTKGQRAYCLQKFKGFTGSEDFLNNNAGTDRYNCYPSGEIRKADPMQDPLVCASIEHYVEVLEIRKNSKRREMARLNSFDYRSAPPAATLKILRDPRVQYATWIDKEGRVRNFGHLGGVPLPYPYLTAEPCWFPLDCLEPL